MLEKLKSVFSKKFTLVMCAVMFAFCVAFDIVALTLYGLDQMEVIIPDIFFVILIIFYGIYISNDHAQAKASRIYYVICGFLGYQLLDFIFPYAQFLVEDAGAIAEYPLLVIYYILYAIWVVCVLVSVVLNIVYKLKTKKNVMISNISFWFLAVAFVVCLAYLVVCFIVVFKYDYSALEILSSIIMLLTVLLFACQTVQSGNRDKDLESLQEQAK